MDRVFRVKLLQLCKDDDLRGIWEDEFAGKNGKQWNEEIRSTLNKVGRFTSVPALRKVLGRPPTIDFTNIMDNGKVLIANLSVGRIGRRPANLIGAFLVSGFTQAAEKRTTKKPRDFALYVDECKNFLTETFDTTLSESRKWRLSLILAHQYIGQIPETVRQASQPRSAKVARRIDHASGLGRDIGGLHQRDIAREVVAHIVGELLARHRH